MGIAGDNAVARPLGGGVTTRGAVCRTHTTVVMTHFGLGFLTHLFNGRSHIAGPEELSIRFMLACDHNGDRIHVLQSCTSGVSRKSLRKEPILNRCDPPPLLTRLFEPIEYVAGFCPAGNLLIARFAGQGNPFVQLVHSRYPD